MNNLREKFFEEHTDIKDGIPVVITHPHNLFEWFEKNMVKSFTQGEVFPIEERLSKLEKLYESLSDEDYDKIEKKADDNYISADLYSGNRHKEH